MYCPRCGSNRVVYGSPIGPVDLSGRIRWVQRIDECGDCDHRWTVHFDKEGYVTGSGTLMA